MFGAALQKESLAFTSVPTAMGLTIVHSLISAIPFFKNKCTTNGHGHYNLLPANNNNNNNNNSSPNSTLCLYGPRTNVCKKFLSICTFSLALCVLFLVSIAPLVPVTPTVPSNRLPSHSTHFDACLAANSNSNSNSSSVCNSNGHCVVSSNYSDGYRCNCNAQWGGPHCLVAVCPPQQRSTTNACSGHGTCYSKNISSSNSMTTAANHFVCHCKKGWAGNVCERPPTACYQKDCGHGTCILAGKDTATASCECQLDWTGTDCQTPICPSNNDKVCSGHGMCSSSSLDNDKDTEQPSCECSDGYSGNACNTPPDSCASYGTCSNQGTCHTDNQPWYMIIFLVVLPVFAMAFFLACKKEESEQWDFACSFFSFVILLIWLILLILSLATKTLTTTGCICESGYYGDQCQFCDFGHFTDNTCERCEYGWGGEHCDSQCPGSGIFTPYCNGNGRCDGDECSCDNNWDGYACDKWVGNCFPADAVVNVRNVQNSAGNQILPTKMDMLSIGDLVEIDYGTFEPIIGFAHRDNDQLNDYWTFQVDNNSKPNDDDVNNNTSSSSSLEIADGHYLYSNGYRTLPRDVNVGDTFSNGKVVSVGKVKKKGLYHPHTYSSTIVVNNVKTSVHTEITYLLIQDYIVTPVMYGLYMLGIPIDMK